MGLRLGLAGLAAILMIASTALFVSDYRVFQFTQTLTSLQARAATDDALPTPRSGWAQREMTQYCINALNDQVFVLFPQELQRQGYTACADLAEQLIATNPTHAEALAIRAVSAARVGASIDQVQSDLTASRLAAPQLTWLADRRLSFVLSQSDPDTWAKVIDGEARILLASSVGTERLAQIYAARPEFRDILQTSAEQTSEQTQRQFLNRVRAALQERS